MDDAPPPADESPPVPPPPVRTLEESDARMWAAFAHLAGLISLLGIPGVLGSLVIWLWRRGEHPMVNEHGKEAVNFQLSLLIYFVVGWAFTFVTCGLGGLLTIPLGAVLVIFVVVFPVIACIRASDGQPYRYPLTIRLVD